MIIYHIVTPEVWEKYKDENEYAAESLEAENFIHCSYRHQLDDVLDRYYRNQEKVLILHINPHLLTAKLVAEPSTNGEVYPHIYGRINKTAIVEVEERKLWNQR
jgi:uncharacterized protein (DUF952 family)